MKVGKAISKTVDFLFSWGLIISVLVLIVAAAMPSLPDYTMDPNESTAIATLRSIIAAQEAFQEKAYIDVDKDGIGEFGYLAELSGRVPLRAPKDGDQNKRAPAVLWKSLGTVNGNGYVKHSGYYFVMYIAGQNNMPCPEIKEGGCNETALRTWESTPGGVNPSEKLWCCYAWPISVGETGRNVFVCNQSGVVLQSDNEIQEYSGTVNPPFPLAAYQSLGRGDMTDSLSIQGTPNIARDGSIWSVCGVE
jgi:hypothetical protein